MSSNMWILPLLLSLTCFTSVSGQTAEFTFPASFSRAPKKGNFEMLLDDNSPDYIIQAVIKDDFGEVLRLIQSNSSFSNARTSGTTALIEAVNIQNIRMVRTLLQYGADANAYVNETSGPPAFLAVEVNNTEILGLLLEHCADPNVHVLYFVNDDEAENRTLLETAAKKNNSRMVELITEYITHGCGRCPAEKRFFPLLNMNWWLPETATRNVANISCPISHGITFGTWRCGANSTWEKAPDLSPCRNVKDLFQQHPEENSATTAAENLTRIAETINTITLLPGDILAIDQALKSLQSQHINHDLLQYKPEAPKLTKQYMTALVNVTGKLLEEPEMWNAMPQEAIKTITTDMQESVVNGALTTAKYLQQNTTEEYPNDNIHVRVAHQPITYYHAEQNRYYKHLVFPETHLQLPEGFYNSYSQSEDQQDTAPVEEKNFLTVIFNSYSDLHCISNSVPCNPPLNPNETRVQATAQVNSGVIGAKVGYGKGWKSVSKEVVEITFSHIYDGSVYQLENPKCVWWDTNASDWSPFGCRLHYFTSSYTLCHCNHLTNLAVIMDINGLLQKETILYRILEWITIFGCSLSIISLAVCINCFLFLKRLRAKRSSSIRANLCFCLLLAEVVLLVGMNATKRAILCKAVAALLHYLFLAAFAWSAIEAFNLYLVLVKVFETQISLQKYYMMVGYGAPLIFVGVTLLVTRSEGYGTDKMCWLAPSGLIWSFAGSLASVMVINLISFVMTMNVAWRERPVTNGKGLQKIAQSSSQLTRRLSGSVAIFFILGLTWVTGFFYMAEGTQLLALMFTLLNSLQGFGIFVFGIALDDNVRKEAKEVIEQRMSSQKVQVSLKGSIIPQRRGSYSFNTESDEISRVADTLKITTADVTFEPNQLDEIESTTKL